MNTRPPPLTLALVCLFAWVQAYPNLIHYNKLDKGGHFAAWEQPELFVAEVRTGLRSPR
jgi:pimeloyl-ACP methyl ester carboxylesterase